MYLKFFFSALAGYYVQRTGSFCCCFFFFLLLFCFSFCFCFLFFVVVVVVVFCTEKFAGNYENLLDMSDMSCKPHVHLAIVIGLIFGQTTGGLLFRLYSIVLKIITVSLNITEDGT